MNKQEFLEALRKGLSPLPHKDIEERLNFYSEMIDDRMEDGLSESQSVSAVGNINEIVEQIISDTPISNIAKENPCVKRKLGTGEIVLLVLGSPIWLSLIIAAIAVIFAVFVSLWSVIVSLWAVFGSFAACSVGGIASFVILISAGKSYAPALAVLSAGIILAGLSVFTLLLSKAATKGILALTKKMPKWIKNCFIRKDRT